MEKVRYMISDASSMVNVESHVLRYWEQEFTQLKPLKRRGNRRYYQHHEVLLIRRIRELLYQYGFRNQWKPIYQQLQSFAFIWRCSSHCYCYHLQWSGFRKNAKGRRKQEKQQKFPQKQPHPERLLTNPATPRLQQ